MASTAAPPPLCDYTYFLYWYATRAHYFLRPELGPCQGSDFRLSWGPLGPSLGPLGALLGLLGTLLGRLGGLLGRLGACLGSLGPSWGRLGGLLGRKIEKAKNMEKHKVLQ